MKRRAIAALLLAIGSPAMAWNKPGHMIVAAEAYDVLSTTHPKTVQRFLTILKSHPEWEHFDKVASAVPPEDRERYLFMIAARWPDDVKGGSGDRSYDHKPWHYVDFPMVFPADRGRVTPEPPGRENALTAFEAQTKTIRNSDNPERQAVALCWIAHLTGDLHQPLHVCSMFSAEFPKGDKGGNADIIRVQDGRAPINLHELWDKLMTTSERYQTCSKIAQELLGRAEYARGALAGVNDPKPYDWAWNSYRAAVHIVYLDGQLKVSTDPKDRAAPILPSGYPQAAKAIAEQQIVLAGYRLADQLVADLGG